jgi:hypothetical protein
MGIQLVKIHFSLALNTRFLMNNILNAVCCPKYLQILRIFLDTILVNLGYLPLNKRHAVDILIVIM